MSEVGIVQLTGEAFLVQIVPVALPNEYVSVYTFVDGVLLLLIVIVSPNSIPDDGEIDGVDAVAPNPILILDTAVAFN